MSSPEAHNPSLETLKERLNIHIRFSPHTTLEDFGDLDTEVRRGGYDFYAPEFAGHTPDKVAIVERIAKGDTKAYERTMIGFDKLSVAAIFRAIFASRINIVHLDASQAQLKADADLAEFGRGKPMPNFDTLEKYIAFSDERAQLGARATSKRDAIFIDNLEAQLPDRVRNHPRLRNQDNLRMLITMGDNHLTLPRYFEERGYRTTTSGLPEVYFATEDVLIGYLNDQKPSDELLLEVVANNIIRPQLYHPKTNVLRQIVRSITSTASKEDIESMLQKGQVEGGQVVYPYVENRLRALGINDPDLRLESVALGSIPTR